MSSKEGNAWIFHYSLKFIFDTTNNISFWHERNNQVVTWLRSLTRDFIQEIAIALCSLSHSYVHSFVLLKLINNR